jgi:hypothetical protein
VKKNLTQGSIYCLVVVASEARIEKITKNIEFHILKEN